MNLKRADLFSLMLKETAYYDQMIKIEQMIEQEADLSSLPAQPLYYAVTQLSGEKLALCLPLMSKEQRSFLTDLSSWRKDHINIDNILNLSLVYAKCTEFEIIQEFVCTKEFLLFLKSRFNIHTFDVENPFYPDHDNYFLTEDQLFLIEFDPEFDNAGDLKFLMKNFYAKNGVKDSYDLLYSLILETHSVMEEEIYRQKVERLRDFAIVDYYEALAMTHPFQSVKQLDQFVKSAQTMKTPSLSSDHLNQTPHYDLVKVFVDNLGEIEAELLKITSTDRLDFLKFDFSRLIHASLSMEEPIDLSRLILNRTATRSRQFLKIGFFYLKQLQISSVFEEFNFTQIYKVGKSLFSFELKKIKKIANSAFIDFDDVNPFEGQNLRIFLDESRHFPVKHLNNVIDDWDSFNLWKNYTSFFEKLTPYINQYYIELKKLKESESIQDSFYLNYSVDQIDIEALLISSFINFELGLYEKANQKKLGLSIDELLEFSDRYFEDSQLKDQDSLKAQIKRFQNSFGMEVLEEQFADYFYDCLESHLRGYDFRTLDPDDFEHVGGPILLRS